MIGAAASRATGRLLVVVWLSIAGLIPRFHAAVTGQWRCSPPTLGVGGGDEVGCIQGGGKGTGVGGGGVGGGGEEEEEDLLKRIMAARRKVIRMGWEAAVGGGEHIYPN